MTSSGVKLSKEDFNEINWQELIEQSDEKTCCSYSRIFYQEADEAGKQRDQKEETLYLLLGNITSIELDIQDPYQPFKPKVILHNSRSAIIDDIEDEYLDTFKEVIPDIIDPEMKARVADVLWIRKRDYQMGQIAAKAYGDSFEKLFDPENWSKCAIRIERALQLSAMLGKKNDLYEKTIGLIENALDGLNGDDPSFLSLRLMELLLKQKQGDSEKYARLSERLAKKAEREEEWRKARLYWECRAKWYSLNKDQDKRKESLVASAETYVKQASEALENSTPSFMRASSFIQSAIESLKRIEGTNDRIEDLHRLLLSYQEKAVSEMQQVSSGGIDVTEFVENVEQEIKGKNLYEAMCTLASLTSSPKVAHLKENVDKSFSELSFRHIFTTVTVDEKGRNIAKHPSMISDDPKEIEAAKKAEMYSHAIYYQQLNAQAIINPARKRLLLDYDIRVQDFMIFLVDNIFVPQGREKIFAHGFYAGLEGDLLTSTHLLIPQLENSIRDILLQHGLIPSTIDSDGTQEERNLNTLLFRPELEEILGEDLTFDLQGLLVGKFGSNLRNKMAHGLISSDKFNSLEMLYLWWLIFRICYMFQIAGVRNKAREDGEGNSE